jgi:serine/threonine protein kinase
MGGHGKTGHAVNCNAHTLIMAKTKPAALPVNTLVGGYRIVRKLSVGGFGAVYLAKDKNDVNVAIKEYLPSSLVTRVEGELDMRVVEDKLPLYRLGLQSFFEEGRALAQISHPSVVGVQNFFRANETIYMVMNYLQGATLQDFIMTAKELRREKILRESTIRSLFDEILMGLRVVHQSKMLHLDIKPANLFITTSNRPVLIDFGASRQVIQNEEADQQHRPMYTPGFAAPEMYEKNGNLGPWTDIYAVGASMYACLLGFPPDEAMLRQGKDNLVSMLEPLRGLYSNNMIDLVIASMALNSMKRPQSVFAMQKQLNDVGDLKYENKSTLSKLRSKVGQIFS